MMERTPERGFTLVELMVVIAVVGVILAAAILSINPDRYAKSAKGYAEEIAVDDNTFHMNTHISHPWWGKVYEYKGRFKIT